MPMTTDQKFDARRWVGNSPSDATLDDNYDRLGDVRAVIREILETRRAEFMRQPASFAIAGAYSQTNGGKVADLNTLLSALDGSNVDGTDDVQRTKLLVRFMDNDDFVGR